MSKISAALSIDSSPNSDNCENTLKYGDDDVSSKRRKDAVADDEYNTVFTRRLNSSCASGQLNSTSHGVEANNYGACCSDDFIGGPVHEHTPKLPTSADRSDTDDAFNVSITTLPSDSSFGFENTFSVLERQLRLSKQPKLNQQQIEYILMKNNDTAVKNPIYIDIPISDEWCLRAISGQANGSLQATTIDPIVDVDTGPPSLFDLEIEAMLRVKELLGTTEKTTIDTVDAGSTTPTMVDTHHIPISTSLIEDFYQQDGGDYSEYVYHVAKSKEGRVYLRVVRSLLVDKGNNLNITYSVSVSSLFLVFGAKSPKLHGIGEIFWKIGRPRSFLILFMAAMASIQLCHLNRKVPRITILCSVRLENHYNVLTKENGRKLWCWSLRHTASESNRSTLMSTSWYANELRTVILAAPLRSKLVHTS